MDQKMKILDAVETFLMAYRKFIVKTLCLENKTPFGEGQDQESREELRKKIDERQRITKRAIPTLGLIYHFVKKDFVENRIADRCWILGEDDWTPESHSLLYWRKQMSVCAEQISELRSRIPYLAEYLVGIDAASEENIAEPWLFAPIFVAARDKKVSRPFLEYDNRRIELPNIGLTFHVGEEFRHILSGLRHVDEVVRFFKYKTGDRLGHAIVLGENIDRWIEENETVVMPRREYLEDLLWLWGKAVYEEINLGVSVDVLQGRIMDLAKQIYGEVLGMTPDMLYDAYLMKFRNDNEQDIFIRLREDIKSEPDKKNGHFCKFYDVKSRYGMSWTKEKIFCTMYCPIYYQKLYQPILVQVREQMGGTYKTVQEELINRIEQIGIYVETNPTSNLIISDIRNLKESTAIRLNSRGLSEGGREVQVTVNSDDPGVFNTTSENELAYIYHSLSNMGYGRESVLAWVDKIRQAGMDSSFIKRVKPASQMLEEIAEILTEIGKERQKI